MQNGESNKIVSIQALRFLAALAVAIGHAEIFGYWLSRTKGMPAERIEWLQLGAVGVDLFFVISGFVMVISTRGLLGTPHARRKFLTRRVIRIVPLYWLMTLAMAAWFWRISQPPEGADLVRSLLFWPFANEAAGGRTVPLLEVGWTLNFEMLFYLIFGLALASSVTATVARVGVVLAALVSAGLILSPEGAAGFWTAPLLVEFVAGMALALLYLRGHTIPRFLRWALMLFALAWLLSSGIVKGAYGWERLAAYGPSALAIVAAVTFRPRLPADISLWESGGDISYALYLCHLPLMSVVQFLWWHFDLPAGDLARAVYMAGTVLGSVIAATVIFFGFERPVTQYLNVRLVRRQDSPG